jgi:hypothetical protein
LEEIRSPKFWPKETLDPILAQYKEDHPEPPQPPTPICKEPEICLLCCRSAAGGAWGNSLAACWANKAQ